MPDIFQYLGQGFVGPIPFSVIVAAVVMALAYFFLNDTVTGRYILATGGNSTATRLTGINVNRYRMIGLVASAGCAALAGIMLTSYLGTGQPNGADAYTMDALAAVFLGMTTIRLGQANILGTLVGC
jgi:ribose/xylose/arabinose/galactoside ABC-type transport system permease subunit